MSEILYRGVVLGEPKAQARHRHFQMKNVKHVQTYDPSKAIKGTFASILQVDAPEKPWDCPLILEFNFFMQRPKCDYRTGKNSHLLKDNISEWHTKKPDIDNLVKFVQDALNKIFYRDDSLICQIIARKLYSEKPRTEITIKSLL